MTILYILKESRLAGIVLDIQTLTERYLYPLKFQMFYHVVLFAENFSLSIVICQL